MIIHPLHAAGGTDNSLSVLRSSRGFAPLKRLRRPDNKLSGPPRAATSCRGHPTTLPEMASRRIARSDDVRD